MEIPNFPSDLEHLHHAWHQPQAHPLLPTRVHAMGSQGGGAEFLTFHRDFMWVVLDWYNNHAFKEDHFNVPAEKASLVAPWAVIPPEMRTLSPSEWSLWEPEVARLDPDPKNPPALPDFADNDAIGFFIESGIHNQFLHNAAADVFHDETVRGLVASPVSTLFYKIHGLVQHWWSLWARRVVFKGSAFLDPNRPVPQRSRDFGAGSTVLNPNRPVPTRFGELTESPVEPLQIETLIARVQRLEGRIFPMGLRAAGHQHQEYKANGSPQRSGNERAEGD
jgi:hypothetical protein